MITIRINTAGEQTLIRADESGANDKTVDALAVILAGWIYERRATQ